MVSNFKIVVFEDLDPWKIDGCNMWGDMFNNLKLDSLEGIEFRTTEKNSSKDEVF